MKNFFEHQEKARKRTSLLLIYFLMAIAAMIAVVYLPIVFIANIRDFGLSLGWLWNGKVFAWTAGPILGVILIGIITKMVQLSKGGSAVARMLRARRVEEPVNEAESRLLNVIEEMAIASGIRPVPVYVLDREKGINAMAAGKGTDDAVILLTAGALEHLSRDELQGLVAHEFSHIFNEDMRLNMKLTGVIFGILIIAIVGVEIAFGGESDGDSGVVGFVIRMTVGLFMIGLGAFGILFCKLIQTAVCRQREFLADASAVQYTRNPEGLSGALKKITEHGSRVRTARSLALGHFFFADRRRFRWLGFFSTHPSLKERLRRLQPLVKTGEEGKPASAGTQQNESRDTTTS